jgi:hypothetical protein
MPQFNPIVKCNIKIMIAGIVYLILLIIFIAVLDMPIPFKMITLALILYLVPYFRLIIYTIWTAGNLLIGDKSVFSSYSSHVLTEYYKTRHNLSQLKDIQSTIFVANYPCPLFNYTIINLLPAKTYMIGLNERYWGVKLFAIYYYRLKAKDNYKELQSFISDVTKQGFNVLAFIEDANDQNKKDEQSLGRLKSGMFSIASVLRIQIIPIYIAPMPFSYGLPSTRDHYIRAGQKMIVQDPEQSRSEVEEFFARSATPHK